MLTSESIDANHPDLPLIRNLYEQAFPAIERIPFAEEFEETPNYTNQVIAFYDDHEFAGFITTSAREDIVLIDYFAVAPTMRGRGIGSAVLTQLQQQFSGKRIVLEIEVLDRNAANYSQRLHRRNFYMRNGFTMTNISYKAYGCPFSVMISGGQISAAEYHRFYDPTLPVSEMQPYVAPRLQTA